MIGLVLFLKNTAAMFPKRTQLPALPVSCGAQRWDGSSCSSVIISTRATTVGTLIKETPPDEWLLDCPKLFLGNPPIHSVVWKKKNSCEQTERENYTLVSLLFHGVIMELSCESLRNPEDRRPASCKV